MSNCSDVKVLKLDPYHKALLEFLSMMLFLSIPLKFRCPIVNVRLQLGLFELWGFAVAQGERWLVLGPGLVLLAAGW